MKDEEILDSWKKISEYLGREVKTCWRWKKELGLPVHHIDKGSKRSKVFAYKSEIDRWLRRRPTNIQTKKKILFGNRWIVIGVTSGFILLSIIFAIFYSTQNISISPPSKTPTIVVIPFKNLNSSEYGEYFSEGIADELVKNLSMVEDLKIIPAFSFSKSKNSLLNTKELSKKKNVDYVLSGNLEKNDTKINLAVRLIRTKDNATLWKAEFIDSLENLFSIQENICKKICETLNLKISPSTFRLNYRTAQDPTAFDSYLKGNYILSRLKEDNSDPWKLFYQGKYYWGKCTPEANELAISLFNQAIKINPDFAPSYLGLAYCYSNYVNFNWDFNKKWLDKAEEIAKIAQKIEPDLPEYYSLLTEIYLIKYIGFNENTKDIAFELAEEGIKKYPNHAQLNSIVGYCYYLRFGEEGTESDFNKALNYKEKSFWLNPYAHNNIVYAELLMLNKEYNKAIEVCNIIENRDSSSMINFRLGEIYYFMGHLERSRHIFQQLGNPWQYKIGSLYYLGMIASQEGLKDEAQRIINEISTISPESFQGELRLASIYSGLGEKELAYKYLRSFFTKISSQKKKFIYYKYLDIDKNFHNFKDEIKKLKEENALWLEARQLE